MVREIPLPKTNGRGTAQWSILSGTCAIAIAEAPLEVPGRASLRMFTVIKLGSESKHTVTAWLRFIRPSVKTRLSPHNEDRAR